MVKKIAAAVRYAQLIEILPDSARRLLCAIAREPSAHLYSRNYLVAHRLTIADVRTGLKRLAIERLVERDQTQRYRIVQRELEALVCKHGLEGLSDKINSSLRGTLRGSSLDEQDYKQHLEDKYLESKDLFEKINAAHTGGLDPAEKKLLKNIRRRRNYD